MSNNNYCIVFGDRRQRGARTTNQHSPNVVCSLFSKTHATRSLLQSGGNELEVFRQQLTEALHGVPFDIEIPPMYRLPSTMKATNLVALHLLMGYSDVLVSTALSTWPIGAIRLRDGRDAGVHSDSTTLNRKRVCGCLQLACCVRNSLHLAVPARSGSQTKHVGGNVAVRRRRR